MHMGNNNVPAHSARKRPRARLQAPSGSTGNASVQGLSSRPRMARPELESACQRWSDMLAKTPLPRRKAVGLAGCAMPIAKGAVAEKRARERLPGNRLGWSTHAELAHGWLLRRLQDCF